MRLPSLLFAIVLLCGCATTKRPPDAGTPPMRLEEAQVRHTTEWASAEVRIPAGLYRPAFRDDGGTYYQGEARIVMFGRAQENAYLYVSEQSPSQHGLWLNPGVRVAWFDAPLPLEPES